MSLNQIMFVLFSAVIIAFSIMSITSRRILRAAIYLLFVLVATSGIYFLLQYQFMAGVQLTLYAGGIVVLIIFSILLTSHISDRFPLPDIRNVVMGVGTALVGSALLIYAILQFPFPEPAADSIDVDMHAIGNQLLATGKNGYVLPFEVISILLVAAMIGAIIIARREKHHAK